MIVFDTSFLVALHSERDVHHRSALAMQSRYQADEWGTGLLLEYVLVETVNVLLRRKGVTAAAWVGDLLLRAADVRFIPCMDYLRPALASFAAQEESRLSLVDTAICLIAREQAGGAIFTFDREFSRQPGIRVFPA